MARMRMQKSRKNVNFVTAVEFLVGHKLFDSIIWRIAVQSKLRTMHDSGL